MGGCKLQTVQRHPLAIPLFCQPRPDHKGSHVTQKRINDLSADQAERLHQDWVRALNGREPTPEQTTKVEALWQRSLGQVVYDPEQMIDDEADL